MAVSVHLTTGTMISTGIIFALFIGSTWTKSVNGLPYSKVFVQSGPEVVPLEYVNYGPPPVGVPGPTVAQLSAAPIGQLLPCVGPCLPGQQIISVQPPSAKLVPYKAPVPSVPAVFTPTKDDLPLSYQYSYVVYDENTGDQKAQTELSDGSQVQGQYSLIQPDGFVREVQYTADDLKGFNAIVKNFLPKSEDIEVKKPEPADPCKNSEALIELSQDAEKPNTYTDTQNPESANNEWKSETNDAESQQTPGFLSYNDIIKCLQAALQNKNIVPKTTSPLTYVILNKPC